MSGQGSVGNRKTGRSSRLSQAFLEVAEGGIQLAATILTAPLLRGSYVRWGATSAEVAAVMPGDELVPDPKITLTRAITIGAPADDVWAWLVQIGQGRGGFYSYDALENLLHCDIHSADRILPEFQDLRQGEAVSFVMERRMLLGIKARAEGRGLITASP